MATVAAAPQHDLLDALTSSDWVLLLIMTKIDLKIGWTLRAMMDRSRALRAQVEAEEVVLLQVAECARKAERKARHRGHAEVADGKRLTQVAIYRLVQRNRERLGRLPGDRDFVRARNQLRVLHADFKGPAAYWINLIGDLERCMLLMKVKCGLEGVSTSRKQSTWSKKD